MKKDFGKIDILVHSLANGPEVTKPLLETSRKVRPTRPHFQPIHPHPIYPSSPDNPLSGRFSLRHCSSLAGRILKVARYMSLEVAPRPSLFVAISILQTVP